jgi:Carboxypeptidase regulatory-like domain
MQLSPKSKSGIGLFTRVSFLAVTLTTFFFIFSLAFVPVTPAQVSTGSLSGTIADAQKAVIAGADIRLVNAKTNAEYHSTSDGNGTFRFTLLPPGTYHLTVSQASFQTLTMDSVPVKVGTDFGLGSLVLNVGSVSTSIEVTNAPPEIENTQAQISTTITDVTIAEFPNILENQGLDFLALTVPGVVNNHDLGFANPNGVGFSVNGIRGRNNDQQIDGQNNNDNSIAGPSLFLSDSEFVSEYQITTSNFGAEYGRNAGSVVNIVTKSGTNDYHGSLYGTENNQRLDTLSNTQKAFEGLTSVPTFNDLFVGGTFGGPIVRDKLFFFGGVDSEIINSSTVYGTGLLTPTPVGIAKLANCFPGSAGVAALQNYGPYSIAGGGPTQQGPPQLVDVSGCSGVEENGIQRALQTDSRQYNFVVKLDYQTAKNHFYGRYIYNKSTFFNIDPGGAGAAAGYPFNEPALAQDYGFSWTRDINNHMANEFRASYGRLNVGFGGNTIGNTTPLPGAVDSALTNITFTDPSLLSFGTNDAFPQLRIVNTYQFQDNWTYYKGRNSFKAGVNFTYQRSPNTFLPNYNGQYFYNDYGALGENVPFQIRIASGDPNFEFREKDTFLYFQDDIKVSRNLTLNLGLTWSYFTQPANIFHNNTVKNQTGSDPTWDPTLPLNVTTFPHISTPTNLWGPNVGFAWSPGRSIFSSGDGKTVLRGGFRIAYDPPFYNVYSNIAGSAPIVLNDTLSGSTASSNPLPLEPFGPAVRSALGPFIQTGIFDPRTFDNTTISPNFRPDKVYSWSLGVQQQIARNSVVEVRYVGNAGRDLFQSIDANPYILGLQNSYPSLVPTGLTPCPAASAAVPEAVGTLDCNQGVLLSRTNSAYSNYNGLQTEIRLNRVWNQLTLKSAYTFSKTTDNVSEIFATLAAGATNATSQNQLNYTGQEYGLSGIDFPNNWVLTVIEELPFFRSQHGFLGHALGGWAVSGVYTLSSGQPYTPSQVQLNCASGGGACDAPPSATNPYDTNFNAGFALPDGALRPFVGSPSAPVSSVGIYAGDACNIYGAACSLSATQLVSLNAINQGGTAGTPVSQGGVRFIANTAIADQMFGTPFGNAGRNILRDFHTNNLNMAIFKTFNFSERYRLQFHADFTNAFNHPNFGSAVGFGIDPFVDDAGLASENVGFANPRVQDGGSRNIHLGAKFFF